MPVRRDEQKARTRARLIRKSRGVFGKHGYDSTSIAAVCQVAGVTHGALYHHFGGKLDLFIAVVKDLHGDIAAQVQNAADNTSGWRHVEQTCDAYLEICSRADVATILLRDAPRVIPFEVLEALDDGINEPLVTGMLRRWVDQGLFCDAPIEATARLLGSVFAEAGTLIANAEDPAIVRAEVTFIIRKWIGALRR